MTTEGIEYTGEVTTGGPAAHRDLGAATLAKLTVGPMNNNAYLLRCTRTGRGVLVDAANEADRLLELIGAGGIELIITTHRHGDHWQALREVAAATGARTVAHPLDAPELPVPPDVLVEHGDEVTAGDLTLSVIHLRGHTPGSIAVRYDGPERTHLFTGDSLFPGGPGNTRGNPDDFHSLMTDLQQRVFATLDDDTWIYPGHGDDTTLGAERPSLPTWQARGW